jgi:ABC-2 type transport system permease protein
MRNVWSVVKYELYTILSKPSFWLTTFLVPLLVIGLNVGTQVLVQSEVSEAASAGTAGAPAGAAPIALVDEAGLVQRMPADIPPEALQAWPSQEAARAAMAAGEIAQFYVIPADFLETGRLLLIIDQFAPISSSAEEEAIRYVLSANLVDDPGRAAALVDPLWSVETHALAPQESGRQTSFLTTVVPIATTLIFYLVLTFTGSYMLQSVTREKENRTAEVLLVSLRPRELLMGKVLALAVLGLGQVIVWVGGSVLVLDQARQAIATAAHFALPAGFFVWGFLYFLVGYLLYGSLMAGLGALAPTAREGNQLVFVIVIPLMVPLLVNTAFSEAPNGALVTFLSLFPLTAPVSMPTRLAVAPVAFWQPLLGLALLAGCAYLVILLAGRLFRADTLLSSSTLSLARVRHELQKTP